MPLPKVDEALRKWRKLNTRATRAQTLLMSAIKRGAADEEIDLLKAEVVLFQQSSNAALEAVQVELAKLKSPTTT